MSYEFKGFIISMMLAIGIVVTAWLIMADALESSYEYKVIESNVVNIEPILETDGSIEYYNITFANGESYNIKTHENIDWTVNSKLIVEIHKKYHHGEPTYDYWYLESLTKVPDKKTVG